RRRDLRRRREARGRAPGGARGEGDARRGPNALVKTLPSRTCLGCRRARPQRDMVRLIRLPNGTVVVDGGKRAAGRGADVCPDAACLERGLSRGRLGHAFRKPSEAAPDLVASVCAADRRAAPALPSVAPALPSAAPAVPGTALCEVGARAFEDVDVIAVRS